MVLFDELTAYKLADSADLNLTLCLASGQTFSWTRMQFGTIECW